MFCDVNFMYRLYHDCARALKRSVACKLAIVQLSSGFGFARNSSRAPCALASFSHARMPRSACTHDVTCELYCRTEHFRVVSYSQVKLRVSKHVQLKQLQIIIENHILGI